MDNGEAFARGAYWNKVIKGEIEGCSHEAEDGSSICNKCWEDYLQSVNRLAKLK